MKNITSQREEWEPTEGGLLEHLAEEGICVLSCILYQAGEEAHVCGHVCFKEAECV